MFFVDSAMGHENYFSGIAYSKDSIVLSTDGLKEYCNDSKNVMSLQGGRYSLMYKDILKNETVILTDPTGQDILFYYQNNKYWAVSNSLLFLVEKLQEKDEKLDIYLPGLLSFQIKHSLGEQPLSNNTLIEKIKILPRDRYILIENGEFNLRKRTYELSPIADVTNYIDLLACALWDQISVINDLATQIHHESIRCDLSGGMDSRLVFGMVYKSNVAEKVKYSSNKTLSTDYLIANSLLRHYDLQINNSTINMPENTIDASQRLTLYKYGNAGIYTKIYQASYSKVPKTLHIHGAGGESLRGQYVGSPKQIIGRLKKDFIDNSQYELVRKEFFDYFNENHLDIDDPKSMLGHSRNFRARFHFGRNWYRFLTNPLFTPLCDIRFENLSDFLQKKYNNSLPIFYDSYMILDRILAFFPFDENKKNLDANKLGSLHVLSSYLPQSYESFSRKIYGKVGDDDFSAINFKRTQKHLTFDELLQEEKEDFVKKHPQLSSQFNWAPNVYTLLNILN